jgi:hypothetical protein
MVATKRPPFSIAIGDEYSFPVKNIEIWAPTFFKHNNSSVATVVKLKGDKHKRCLSF